MDTSSTALGITRLGFSALTKLLWVGVSGGLSFLPGSLPAESASTWMQKRQAKTQGKKRIYVLQLV